jgi:hypothetical protein
MKRLLFTVLCLLVATVGLTAQAPIGTPTSVFLFDQAAPDAATAQAYTYRIYVDGAATGQAVPGVLCVTGATAGVHTCRMPFPAFAPGSHSVQLTAGNAAGESGKSTAFTFTLVAVPGVPGNIRIGSGS